MNVTHALNLDMQLPSGKQTIYAKQGDSLTRTAALTLYNGGSAFDVSGVEILQIAFSKPDKTGGLYDTMPDDSPACSVSGNVVTAQLHPQMFTAAGRVKCELRLLTSSGVQLSSFTWFIFVEAAATNDIKSESYYRFATLEGMRAELIAMIQAGHPVAKGLSKDGVSYVATGDDLPAVAAAVGTNIEQIIFIPYAENTTETPSLQLNDGEAFGIRLRAPKNQGDNAKYPEAALPVPVGTLMCGVPYLLAHSGIYWYIDSAIGSVKALLDMIGDISLLGGNAEKTNLVTAINELISRVFEKTEVATFTNLLAEDGSVEYGKLLETDGTVSETSASLAVTEFMPITVGQVVRMAGFAIDVSSDSAKIVLYDAEKNKVTQIKASAIESSTYYFGNVGLDDEGNVVQFTLLKTSGVAYFRICTNTAAIESDPILTIDEEIAYEIGYGTKLNGKVSVDYSQILNAPNRTGWSILPYEHLNIAYSSIGRLPINTVEHFADAAENYGFNALKCDIRPTADGELICCHDAGFTFDENGYITTYDSENATMIHDVTAQDCIGYSFPGGQHPCLVGDYLKLCRKYGKIAFVTIRDEYMDVVVPKLLSELKKHNMLYSTIINSMTYNSLITWRTYDTAVMLNYTLNYGADIDQNSIDKAVALGYCSLCGFGVGSRGTTPFIDCDFEYARANGIRLLQAIAYVEGTPEVCYDMGYDGCQIGFPWNSDNETE